MPLISSANIATGFHAGDPSSMRRTVEMAAEHGVAIGAHPGFRDLVGFGRRHIAAPAIELVNDMLYQLGALREFARLQGLSLQHVKPHGALYMHLARDEVAARLFVETRNAWNRNCCPIACPVRPPGASAGNWASRWYASSTPTATTTAAAPSSSPGGSPPLDPQQVADKVLRACREGKVRTVEGEDPDIAFDLGVHPQRYPRCPGAGRQHPCAPGGRRHPHQGAALSAARPASLATSFSAISYNVRIMRIRHGRT